VNSLSAHLTAGPDHARLGFHPACAVCRNQRLAGALSDTVLSARAHAGLLAAALAAGTLVPGSVAAASDSSTPPTATASQAPPPAPTPAPEPSPAPAPDVPPFGTDETQEAPADEAPHMRELLTSPEAGTDTEGEDVSGEADETAPAPMPVGQAPAEPAPAELAPVPLGQPPAPPLPIEPPPAPPQPVSAPSPPPSPEPVAPSPAAELEQDATAHPADPDVKRKARGRKAKPRRPAAKPVVDWEDTPERENAPASVGAGVPAAAAKTALVSQPAKPVSDHITGAIYTVQPGDSLWSIACRLVGPRASAARIARELNRLWELNREQIGTGDPSLIYAGTVLRIQ
jgi:LysM domain